MFESSFIRSSWYLPVGLGTALLLAAVAAALLLPKWLGKPITRREIAIIGYEDDFRSGEADYQHVLSNTKVRTALSVLVCVYGNDHDFVISNVPLQNRLIVNLADYKDAPRKARMRFPSAEAGDSYLDNDTGQIRMIVVKPDHFAFTSRTIAHEFGHHCFGDVGVPDLSVFSIYLNMIWDIRINRVIRRRLEEVHCAA